MCGIIGLLLANENEFVNQMLFDGLTVLQHRGQDAAGIVTSESTCTHNRLHLRKDNGLVKDVFHIHHMMELRGNCGLGHCRYPTSGTSGCAGEAQPLYTNHPFGICVAHNGNLTNAAELISLVRERYNRHINTDSDSELLLNLFAEHLHADTIISNNSNNNDNNNNNNSNNNNNNNNNKTTDVSSSTTTADNKEEEEESSTNNTNTTRSKKTTNNTPEIIFNAMSKVMEECKGGYAGLFLIHGVGIVGFRDPHGIRPLVFGKRKRRVVVASNTKTKKKGKEDGEEEEEEEKEEMMMMNGNSGGGGRGSGGNYRPNLPSTPEGSTDGDEEDGGVNNGNANGNGDDDDIRMDYCMASESVAIDTLGFDLVRDVGAGEVIFIDLQNQNKCHSRICSKQASLSPCIFEYVYFARPDSIMDGVSVYETRLKMGEKLALKIMSTYPKHDIDVVIPIPDTSRTSALQAAYVLERPFREGFIKNRYIARTFIMPGQATRKKSVRLKLNTIKSEFNGRNVLLVDDSVVRGTTAHEIVQMAREAGAQKVYMTSAAPPIRYPNIYGIDIPTRHELIAFGRNEDEVAKRIGCDWMVYQDLHDLENSVKESSSTTNVPLKAFDTSCFSGTYVTGECIDENSNYFNKLHDLRNDKSQEEKRRNSSNACEAVLNNMSRA